MNPTIRQAIARIDVLRDGQSASRGTGTLVTADLVLTAMHVVADRTAAALSLYPGAITLAFPGFVTEAQVVDRGWNPNADWILLRCVTPPPIPPLPLADSVSDGAQWETYGFPDANPRDGMVQIGTVDNATGSFENVHAFQLFSNQASAGSGAPVKGLSGGPVIVDGAMVAVLRSSLMRDGLNVAGTLYGCPVDLILQATGELLPVPDPVRGLPGLPRQPLPASPFRFLDRFSSADAEIFFGRNREIRQVRDTVIATDGPPVILLYGQSGAGKSSFLDAGLLPRLAAPNTVAYLRRDRGKGLLGTLLDGLRAQVAARAGAPTTDGPDALRLAWLEAEASAAKPVVMVLDQVEEVFTQPGQDANELVALITAVAAVFGAATRPRGRLILGFRKEWFAEIQKQLEERNVEFAKVFLETLDQAAIVEIIAGLQTTKRLRDRYGLDLETGLADKIARDLSADSDSPVAPTLQVLLSKMWRAASSENSHAPRFSEDLYDRLNKDGVLLTDFFDQQVATLQNIAAEAGGTRADSVTSGLAVDVLVFYTSAFGSAEQRASDELRAMYAHRPDDAGWIVEQAKSLFLLTDPAGDGDATRSAARLSHDTLAHVVRARYEVSGRPGQRARRILENRAAEWSDNRSGVALDARDLGLVEQGLAGMRQITPDETRLFAASREEVERQKRGAAYRRWAAIAAVLMILVAIGIGAWLSLLEKRQQQWSALFELDALVQVLLEIEPVNGLVAAVEAVDRNLVLNKNTLLPGTRGNLMRALDGARERVSWRLDVPADAIAIAGDNRIAVGTNDGIIRVFESDGTDAIPPIRGAGSTTTIRSVAFSADGVFIAAAMDNQGLGVWSRDGKPLPSTQTPGLPLGAATAVRFAPDGHTIVAAFAAGDTRTLYLCDLDDPTTARVRAIAVDDAVTEIATLRTSQGLLLIATAGGDVKIWGDSGVMLWTPGPQREPVTTIDLARIRFADLDDPAAASGPPHVLLAAGNSDGAVSIWDTSTAELRTPILSERLGSGKVVLAFGYQGRLLHAASADGNIRSYDVARKIEATERFVTSAAPNALRASPDGKRIVTVGVRNTSSFIQTFDVAGPQLLFALRAPHFMRTAEGLAINGLAFAGDTLMVAALGNSVPAWRLNVGPQDGWANEELTSIDSGQDETTAIASDARGQVVLLAGAASVQILRDGKKVGVPAKLPAAANAAALAPNGSSAIVGSDNGQITMWDTATGTLVRTLDAHTGDVWSVAYDLDGRRFASAGADSVIRFWNSDGTPRTTVKRATNVGLTALAFHSDGTIFSGDSAGRIERLAESGAVRTSTQLFRSESVTQIAIEPRGEIVFVSGAPGIRVLDAVTGSVLSLRFPKVNENIQRLALRSDGTLLAGATLDGDIMLWHADWHAWFAAACDRLNDHAVFRSLRAPVPSAIVGNAHGVDYAAAAQSCSTHLSTNAR